VVPARARKPRDKAAAENAVNVVNKRVIGYLESEVCTTLQELNNAIAERVGEVNHDLRRADGTTRWEQFRAEEQPLLAPLPATRFEEVTWKEVKAARNYHVSCDYQRYSVPYRLAGRLGRVRLTSTRVTIFDGHDLVCEHPRRMGRKGQYTRAARACAAPAPGHRRTVVTALVHRPGTLVRARDGVGDRADPRPPRHSRPRATWTVRTSWPAWARPTGNDSRPPAMNCSTTTPLASYTTLKRLMAAINSDAKKPRKITPAPSTRKRTTISGAGSGLGPDVYVRDASHYELTPASIRQPDGERDSQRWAGR